MQSLSRATLTAAAAGAAALLLAACGSGTPGGSAAASSGSGGSTAHVSISLSELDSSFSAMAKLKPVAAAGKGSIAVILPDTTSSTRYEEFDRPYLQRAFAQAGVPSSDVNIHEVPALPCSPREWRSP